jgi:hypothetical protein
MAQLSFPWPGDSGAGGTGDCGPYTADAFSNWYEKLFCSDSTNECVIPNIGNELAVTGTATPLSVNTGSALVNGKFYNNSAATTLAIATPVAATRIDRVILRADYTAQTVRLVLLPGAEGGAAPSLTQTDGTTWEVSLAQASITTGGVVTCTSERVFLHFNSDIETAMVEAGAITAAGIANRTRTFIVPGLVYNGSDSAFGIAGADGQQMIDNKNVTAYGVFYMPSDYVSGMTVSALVHGAASGDCYCSAQLRAGALTEDFGVHNSDIFSTAVQVLVAGKLTAVAAIAVTQATAGDAVYVQFFRDGDAAEDTVGNIVYFIGFQVTYTADS